MFVMRRRRLLLAGIALLSPFPALAQTAPATADPAVVPPPQATTAGTKRVYSPADFARYAPKSAYDILVQVPSFSIKEAEQERGLGQASENVLINGQRSANKAGGGAIDELRKTPVANVERIEIVDAASLGIAGLSGQVANIIVNRGAKGSGQFEWNPDIRAHYTKANLLQGNVSYSGKSGPVDYTLAVKNDTGRGGFGGPIRIYEPDGTLREARDEVYHGESSLVTFSGKFGLDGPGSSIGNLLLAYTPYWAPSFQGYRRTRADGKDGRVTNRTKLSGWYYDVNGDYEFALGPGRLKLIGVRHFDHEPIISRQRIELDSGAPDQLTRFDRDSRIGETVARSEYRWKTGRNDWQVSLERAFNSLDQRGAYFQSDAGGVLQPVDLPGLTGNVQEVRYEGIVTLSRPLSPKLDLQVDGGGEISRLERVDGDLPARKFFRPKGSITLGWRPAAGWDASLKLRRRVGQISFYDFLDQPNLQSERENSGNPDLVPPQSWELETEVGRELGAWGKTRLRAYAHRIDDIIDVVPIGEDSEGVGNLPRATRFGFESVSTIQFDPIGWTGAKLDATFGAERTRVKDPLTGEDRSISGTRDRWMNLQLRHDIPRSDWAYGGSVNYDHYTPYFRLTEVYRSWEGPWWFGAFVENKDVMGLTVRAEVSNIFNARHRLERVNYSGYRDAFPISSRQSNNQLIGPIFELLVKGTF
ncbi:TonB-dependent receptor [Sphingomonas piscis]|uniref:TonB-dependent receptor n=1 Tax=Sphingomonas piscis TaxID=2714943 RepID=A0A6G7YPU4_9SPHN|nr:TonB-dependent receptor plug domain-containing protein [Sphingomonas piscis]QIK78762.1 TonB-dependent receptor [Sphingomonas piscis]